MEGPLQEFSINDIISLVSLGKQTGSAEIEGLLNGRSVSGCLYFKAGNVCHANLLELPPLEAALTFFILEEGYFRFRQGQKPDREDLKTSNELLIMQGINRVDQWKAAQALVQPGDIPVLIPKPASLNSTINLSPDDWKVLTSINGQNDLVGLAQKTNLGQFKTTLALANLFRAGLVEKKPRSSKAVLYPELERLATGQPGQPAKSLLDQTYQRLNLQPADELSLEQAIQVVNNFRRLSALMVGPGPAEMLDEQIRAKLKSLYHR